MRNLYLKALAFLLALGSYYFLELFYLSQSSATTLDVGRILFGLLAPILTLAFPHVSRRSAVLPVAGWGIIFLVIRLLGLGSGAVDVAVVWRILPELALFILVVALAHVLSRSLLHFYLTVRELTQAAAAAHLPTADEAMPAVRRELARSRQYERPLSVLMIDKPPPPEQETIDRLILEAQQGFLKELYRLKYVEAVHQSLRPMDILMVHGDRLAVLCPEGSENVTSELAASIRAGVTQRLSAPVDVATARFPEEGLTFAGLLATADERLDEHASGAQNRRKALSSLSSTPPA